MHFVRGVPAEQMPVIVPRICGVCSTAHHVAAVKALEDAYEVTPPPLALKIREQLLLGQIVQNQATSLFIFTMPDRLGIASIFSLADEDLGEEGALLATRVLRVRKAGTNLIITAGGQFIHPIKAVVGGVTSGIAPEAAAAMRDEIEAVFTGYLVRMERAGVGVLEHDGVIVRRQRLHHHRRAGLGREQPWPGLHRQ